jgi:signal transduction histidine kinase/ligand-binding sensor domain-containing protein
MTPNAPNSVARSCRFCGATLGGLIFISLFLTARGQELSSANQPQPATGFALKTWRADTGLPQNTVTAVLQTRRGYIWVGTYNGLAQFDGLQFRVFNSANAPGLANSRVTSLFEEASGQIWIGHDTGEVSMQTTNGFSTAPPPAGWSAAPIKDFITDESGAVWAFNQRGDAWRLADGQIVRPPPALAENPFVNPSAARDGQQRGFVLRNGGVARFTAAGYVPIDFGDPAEQPYYIGISAARNGSLWVLGEGLVRQWNGSTWSANFGALPWSDASVTMVRETSAGQLLVGTLQSGLFIFTPPHDWTYLNRATGLPQDWVTSLTEDREGNLWVGTGGGLALLRHRKVTMHSPPDDWEGRPVLSILRAQDGAVWAATEGAGIYRYSENGWTRHDLENPFVWSLYEDSAQRLWAGTWGGGLFQRQGESFVFQTNAIPVSDPVTAFCESPAGTLWIGTGAGLFRMRSNVWEHLAALGGAAAGDVRALTPGAPGELWIGTQGSGLGLLRNGTLRTFTTADGLPANFILSLHYDPDGTLWIGTLDMGLGRYRHGEFRAITMAHGLPANILFHIREDDQGHLWFNSSHGIFRVSKQQLHACADGKVGAVSVLAYGQAEGLATLAGTGGFTPSGFRAPDGKLWFSTARGIAVVTPAVARPNPVLPPVWIEDVVLDGQDYPLSNAGADRREADFFASTNFVVLPPGRRQLDIAFTGLSFRAPERVRFKYRLEGLDRAWTEASSRRVTYSFLPPGQYTFRVIACNSDGLWNETGATLGIRVRPHFWQTLWFKILLALAGALGCALLVHAVARRRHRLKLERIARERALERERARIAQDIHDDLGASLTRIGLLSETAAGDLENPERAAANLEQIILTTRELTRSMDEIVWAVNPRHDTLESLANYIARFAQDFLSAAQIRCRLALPLQLPERSVRSEVRHNLFLACKEALHNVVKHSRANEVRLTLELLPSELHFTIADNGTGIAPAQPNRTPPSSRPAAGNGLFNLEARLRQIGGRSRVQSVAGEGTRVEFFVPLGDLTPPGPAAAESGLSSKFAFAGRERELLP